MTREEAINWIIRLSSDLGKVEHQDLWHYSQALSELREMLESEPERKKESCRAFVELLAEYKDPEICPYEEFKGGPYYSIKYIENGEGHIGYGTYDPKVLSEYLRKYFIEPERPKGKWIKKTKITEADTYTSYDPEWYCSDCGTKYDPYFASNINFCAVCGCAMNQEEGEE